MENVGSDDLTTTGSVEGKDVEVRDSHISAADLQRAHTRVVTRLGDVACEGRDTAAVELDPEF